MILAPLLAIRRLIEQCPTWHEWRGPTKSVYVMTEPADTPPIPGPRIYLDWQDDMTRNRVSVDTGTLSGQSVSWHTTGRILLVLMTPPEIPGDDGEEAALFRFVQRVESLMGDIEANANNDRAGEVEVVSWQLALLQRTPYEQRQLEGDYHEAAIALEWRARR